MLNLGFDKLATEYKSKISFRAYIAQGSTNWKMVSPPIFFNFKVR